MIDPDLVDHRPTHVMEVLSTITSPVFSELVIIPRAYPTRYLPREVTLFDTLRKMYGVRPFKLVFLLEVPDLSDVRRELADALELVTAKGFLGFLDSQPTIRATRTRCSRWDPPEFD